MGQVGPRYQLRPLNGGEEQEAEPDDVLPAMQSDALSGAVAEVNARTRRPGLLSAGRGHSR